MSSNPYAYAFSCPLVHGMHARPASLLTEITRAFNANARLINRRTGASADAQSVLSVIALDIRHDDPCSIEFDGDDAASALASIRDFIETRLAASDESLADELAPATTNGVCAPLPPLLGGWQGSYLEGTRAVGGIARGQVVLAGFGFRPLSPRADEASSPLDTAREWSLLKMAIMQLSEVYEREKGRDACAAQLIAAHQSILTDSTFADTLKQELFAQDGCRAVVAVIKGYQRLEQQFMALENRYLRERIVDLFDVCARLVATIDPTYDCVQQIVLMNPSIVVAQDLTPSQFLALDKGLLAGLVLQNGSQTSHVVILARALGIPTLVGVPDVSRAVGGAGEVIVDASFGHLFITIDQAVERYYLLARHQQQALAKRQMAGAALGLVCTKDGVAIEVAANVGSVIEAQAAHAQGADGIGLMRTEFLFMDRESAPILEEQVTAYQAIIAAMAGRPVIVRLLDVGGDKPIRYMPMPQEENPFLGCRAVRFYPTIETLVRIQLRALARASLHGPLRIMVPMVSALSEVRYVRRLLDEELATLKAEGVACAERIELGIMLEIPAVAFIVPQLAAEVDFFSLGTNDLAQYFFAADRAQAALKAVSDPAQPAFIAFLRQTISLIKAQGRWVGLCGEMGGDLSLLPLLVGLGLDEISVGPAGIGGVKSALAALSASRCRDLVAQVCELTDAAEVRALMASFPLHDEILPLLTPGLVTLSPLGATKGELLKEMAGMLFVDGRTDDPLAVERALWAREATYSTGLGHGFAIPHCKSAAVKSATIVVAKPVHPVVWGSLDDNDVTIIIMLAMPESAATGEHMKIFARLARRIMHEEFREHLVALASSAEIVDYLTSEIAPV